MVSAAKEERFAEFYTGEVFDERIRHTRRAQDMSFCRRIFQHRYAGRGIDPLQAWPLDHIAASDADGVVSFSAFCPLPFHVQRWLAVDAIAPHGGEYAFLVSVPAAACVCGAPVHWRPALHPLPVTKCSFWMSASRFARAKPRASPSRRIV